MELSMFIPCYNEEEILQKNTNLIYNKLKEVSNSFELVIVDDSSNDKTPEIAKDLVRELEKDLENKVRYIRYDNGPSRRENLAEAFKTAKGEIIAFIDIDLAVDLFYLKQLIDNIRNRADISIGSRYLGIKPKRKITRKIISILYNGFMRLYFKSKIRDHQCGFKAFKKDILFNLLTDMGYDHTFKRGWFWDVEILVRAQKKGFKIREFPVKWVRRGKSSFNLSKELKIISYIKNLKW